MWAHNWHCTFRNGTSDVMNMIFVVPNGKGRSNCIFAHFVLGAFFRHLEDFHRVVGDLSGVLQSLKLIAVSMTHVPRLQCHEYSMFKVHPHMLCLCF